MPYKKTKGTRGAVLIIVLIVLGALAVLSAEFSRYAFLDYALSSSTRSVLSSKLLAESAEQFVGILLIDNYNKEQTLGKPPLNLEELDGIWASFSEEFRVGNFEGSIQDENRFFPLNRIFFRLFVDESSAEKARAVLQRMLEISLKTHGHNGSNQEIESIAEGLLTSMLQWGGVEEIDAETQAWYLAQDPPRLPPKRPFLNPQELWLLHWPDVTPELQSKMLLGTEKVPGLLDTITVWSTGPMNVNTLMPTVLAALPTDPRQADTFVQDIVKARANKETRENPDWYKEIFAKFDKIPLPLGLIDSKTRTYRLVVLIGTGARKTHLLSIGSVTFTSMTWFYRMIQ